MLHRYLAGQALERRDREMVAILRATALIDLGRLDEATAILGGLAEDDVSAWYGRPERDYLVAEAALAGGRLADAVRAIDSSIEAPERETVILRLAGAGMTNQQIAQQLGVGRPTVARLIASAEGKLGASTRAQAVALHAGA